MNKGSSFSKNSSVDDRDEASQSPQRDVRRKDRIRRDTEKSRDDSDSNLSNPQEAVIPIPNNAMWGGIMGMNYPMPGLNVIVDPNMGNLMTMGNYGLMPPAIIEQATVLAGQSASEMRSIVPQKEIIHCRSCTLFPPAPGAPAPATRERPPGCRTVFVGGLPENMTETILHDIFSRCGEIATLRLSKKNFCHVRFAYETSVDNAIYLSGYRVRIGSNSDPPNTGKLHVDYAQARDDQYEWECKQRQLQRERRHRARLEEERLRPPSPPVVVHFSEHEATMVAEQLKQDESFGRAVQVVITWLERGDCSKRNSTAFYSMIQSTNAHVRRLRSEKKHYEEELRKARDIMKGRVQGILIQFSQIERLFVAACHKKVWDHFTKAQRKNIEQWKKQSMEIKTFQLDENGQEKADDEMDVSDEDEPTKKRHRSDGENASLKEENDSLRCQLEAYRNEVEIIKADYKKELDEKDKQYKAIQQMLQNTQRQLSDLRRQYNEEICHNSDTQNRIKISFKNAINNEKEIIDLDSESEQQNSDVESNSEQNTSVLLKECQAKFIAIISTFLNVHPQGAGLDYIWSYVTKLGNNIKPSDIELLMSKYPSIFKQEVTGIGANIERRWLFNGFSRDD